MSLTPFTDSEIEAIREGNNGVYGVLPGRFYTDQEIFDLESEKILTKQWLHVGRWDQAENPGDYFTVSFLGQSIIIVRNREMGLHALVNVCQHRLAQVVEDGIGNANLFVCPYHKWTYNLDGSLRGIALQPIEGFDTKKCSMPTLRVEEWQGFIFINFDDNAEPLAPQLADIAPLFSKYGVDKFQIQVKNEYEMPWNYKLNLENGYEGYHHLGLHEHFHVVVPGNNTRPHILGDIFGSYTMWPTDAMSDEDKMHYHMPFGLPPWLPEYDADETADCFVFIYPTLMMWLSSYQATFFVIGPDRVDMNKGGVYQAFAPWAIEQEGFAEARDEWEKLTLQINSEDKFGLTMLQKGANSAKAANSTGILHPLERQMNHWHRWYIDQMSK